MIGDVVGHPHEHLQRRVPGDSLLDDAVDLREQRYQDHHIDQGRMVREDEHVTVGGIMLHAGDAQGDEADPASNAHEQAKTGGNDIAAGYLSRPWVPDDEFCQRQDEEADDDTDEAEHHPEQGLPYETVGAIEVIKQRHRSIMHPIRQLYISFRRRLRARRRPDHSCNWS